MCEGGWGKLERLGLWLLWGKWGHLRTGCIADIVLDQYLKSRKMSGAF